MRLPARPLLTALLAFAVSLGGCGTYTVVMRQDELQQRVAARFPLERAFSVAALTFRNPLVVLPPGSDRIVLRLDVEAEALFGLKRRGTVEVSGGLRYDPATAGLYLQSPRVEKLSVEGLPSRMADDLRVLLTQTGTDILGQRPIHTIEGKTLKEKAARLALRSVEVKDGQIVATLGPR